jgi:hypothetical protein
MALVATLALALAPAAPAAGTSAEHSTNEASPLTAESGAGQTRGWRAVCGDGCHGDGE